MAQVIEYLPSNCEALSSTSSTTKKQNKIKNHTEGLRLVYRNHLMNELELGETKDRTRNRNEAIFNQSQTEEGLSLEAEKGRC
jgi:hypothetical protein